MTTKPVTSAHLVRPSTFFILTYLLSWGIWIPLDLAHFEIGPFQIPEAPSTIVRLLGVLVPATSAMLLTAWAGGRSTLRSLLRRLAIWRVGWVWWAAAVLFQPTLLVLCGLMYNWIWGNPPVTATAVTISALVVNIIFLALATLGEEIGWRGLALPALERQHSALLSSLILGILWGVWHVPFWLLLDTFDQFGSLYILINVLGVIPMTIYITWFFNHSQASILLPVAFHLAFNIVNTAIFEVTTNIQAYTLFVILEWIVAILLIPRLEASPDNQVVSVVS